MTRVQKAFKYRFYPTEEQKVALGKTFGSCRYVYNQFLSIRTDYWQLYGISTGYNKNSAQLTNIKQMPGLEWLNELSSAVLQQSLRHLDKAYSNFFAKRSDYPEYKTKGNHQSATFPKTAFSFKDKTLKLAKMPEALDIRWSQDIPKNTEITSVTVSKDPSQRYFVSFQCEADIEAKPEARGHIGIDLGITSFASLSTGEKIESPHAFRKYQKKLATAQRRLAKKQKGSQNRKKANLKVARIHAKIADIRKDFINKLSTELVTKYGSITLETLDIKEMSSKKQKPNPKKPNMSKRAKTKLNKSILDQGWGEFARQIEYKAQWNNRTLIKVPKHYASSKICSVCGHKLKELDLSIRHWQCPTCSTKHDRDHNAALNLVAAGMAVSACGERVRLQSRILSGGRLRSVNQESTCFSG